MSTPVEKLIAFIKQPSPRITFAPPDETVTALQHLPEPAADAAAISDLTALLAGHGATLIPLYQHMNGARLFANAADIEECIFFLPIEEMVAAKTELEEWVFMHEGNEDLEVAYEEETDKQGGLTLYGAPPWWKSVIVFAGFGYAPERFFMPTEGPHAGKIFVYDHDGDYCVLFADSVDDMLVLIAEKPVEFLARHPVAYYDVAQYITT
jgi:hypothetical protein